MERPRAMYNADKKTRRGKYHFISLMYYERCEEIISYIVLIGRKKIKEKTKRYERGTVVKIAILL